MKNDTSNTKTDSDGNVIFTSPLGFKVVLPATDKHRKDVYQKPTKANIVRSSIVKFPNDKQKAIELIKAELRVRDIHMSKNEINSYYSTAKKMFDSRNVLALAS